ncbi:hypothetical protein AUEXF2481DRAFT_255773 [Aureobasidium subglaciale EXF-2481]|uniref:Uncharacterized protein n=1 Tax=Aureobasidium subglaciale (strain EXF-2481) TaxID=1043005 RepID=A0A074YAF3_AURSE|nr:uncharacterized protein AUEXF2481DRAFT_255773 [Aureobasidium subglaciale EXF-2481]KAI5212532.1 hypothetical protein E4T38_00478 [Aureobasidium subglaciale]KAI5231556.1 hypothetical protein E4T40_00426 [Aureobasidium subglaciale]KAI5234320.1 hypothetical protein E4T41_00477 [Aureobasidium subglaciale]KAI5267968.1 hypothetical protein E4T46_00477 [Aureobasidium subglaciale]KEQ94745.1 hypothetical protein AUEXF2481DRAFT_255773 [Aureobasidium subglaciale EXF-2481]
MFPSILLHLSLAVSFAASIPIQRRALSQNDIIGLQLAGYLENLELSLYSGGCEGFTNVQWATDGFPATFQQDVCAIAEQQQNQTEFISTTLETNGIPAPQACSYSLSYDSPTSFVLLANQITSLSLGYYLGSLAGFSPELQTVAASILSVEARHDAIIRNGMGASPFPTNQDVPLSSIWAYNLAQNYTTSCPQQLPIDLLPPLSFNGISGSTLDFSWTPSANNFSAPVGAAGQNLYLAIVHTNASDPIYQEVQTGQQGQGTVQLPEGLGGVVYAALTASSGDLTYHELTTTGTLAGPAQLVLS